MGVLQAKYIDNMNNL